MIKLIPSINNIDKRSCKFMGKFSKNIKLYYRTPTLHSEKVEKRKEGALKPYNKVKRSIKYLLIYRR